MNIITTTHTERTYTFSDDPMGTLCKITLDSSSGCPGSINVTLMIKIHDQEYVYTAEHATRQECIRDLAGIPRDVLIQEISQPNTFNPGKSLQQTFEMLDMIKGQYIEKQVMDIIKYDMEKSVREKKDITPLQFYTQVQGALLRHDQTCSVDVLQALPVIVMDYPRDVIYAANMFVEHIQPMLKEEKEPYNNFL